MGSQEWGGKAQGSSLSCGSGHDRAMWSPRAKEHRNNLGHNPYRNNEAGQPWPLEL